MGSFTRRAVVGRFSKLVAGTLGAGVATSLLGEQQAAAACYSQYRCSNGQYQRRYCCELNCGPWRNQGGQLC